MTTATLDIEEENADLASRTAALGAGQAAPAPTTLTRCNVLGVGISAVNLTLATQTIDGWIARREKNYVCITGVHGVMECQSDETLRQIHNRAGMVTPD